MTGQELTGLIGALGFPIVLVLAFLWFVKRDVWPQIVKWVELNRAASEVRHREFIEAVRKNGASEEVTGKMLIIIDQKLDDHRTDARQIGHKVDQVLLSTQRIEAAINKSEKTD